MSGVLRQLGRYELLRRIAVGGMGEIFLARTRGTAGFEKRVIIKTILPHLAEEEEFVEKFLDEGHIVVQLTHGNIVPVFDMDQVDGEYYIAMEYIPGRDLRELLKRVHADGEIVPIELAVHIASEMCKGLAYAHRKVDDAGVSLGIVHRDVSPSNVLLSREGEVKIIDFGIARATSRIGRTATGRIQGKFCYMSPEQASGKSLDHRSDLFSVGVVLYEMLTGMRPFQGDSDMQSLELVRACAFDAPSLINPKVPEELDEIVLRALSRDAGARYESGDAMQIDLMRFLFTQHAAITAQTLAEYLAGVFPDGVERSELSAFRTGSPSHKSPKKMSLDDALELELARLGGPRGTPTGPSLHTATSPGDAGALRTVTVSDEVSAGRDGLLRPRTSSAGTPALPAGLAMLSAEQATRTLTGERPESTPARAVTDDTADALLIDPAAETLDDVSGASELREELLRAREEAELASGDTDEASDSEEIDVMGETLDDLAAARDEARAAIAADRAAREAIAAATGAARAATGGVPLPLEEPGYVGDAADDAAGDAASGDGALAHEEESPGRAVAGAVGAKVAGAHEAVLVAPALEPPEAEPFSLFRVKGFKRTMGFSVFAIPVLIALGFLLADIFGEQRLGDVVFDTEPSGAQIYIDGALVPNVRTPEPVKLLAGKKHHVKLVLDGHRDIEVLVSGVRTGKRKIYEGRDFRFASKEHRPRAPVEKASAPRRDVAIKTNPPGGEVAADGVVVKGTPPVVTLAEDAINLVVKHPRCDARSYTLAPSFKGAALTLELLNCKPEEADMGAAGSAAPEPPKRPRTIRHFRKKYSNKTALDVRASVPGAAILVRSAGAVHRGTGRLRVEVASKRPVEIIATAPGYEEVRVKKERANQLRAGKLTLNLKPVPKGCVMISTELIADVKIAGKTRHATHGTKIQVPAGRHRYTARQPALKTERDGVVVVKPGGQCAVLKLFYRN